MKKQLIITSSNTAKEINPMGEEPELMMRFPSMEWKSWKQAEQSLKEYRIVNVCSMTDNASRMTVLFKIGSPKKHWIGDKYEFETNEEDLTAIIL